MTHGGCSHGGVKGRSGKTHPCSEKRTIGLMPLTEMPMNDENDRVNPDFFTIGNTFRHLDPHTNHRFCQGFTFLN
jgi:hypothetical protein